ncbi:hypothetical protein [Nostoc sp. 2RC]|uniref:hypothetical protein n=1 Tax=Nostoc sp. 2RC TaxID=2485484 RepID=UPI0017ECCC9F|nr:hypothetical protein [Nostoc sp. 2RC]MBC1241089.1 hypothetical protein [Nostoc sp. 2RC]
MFTKCALSAVASMFKADLAVSEATKPAVLQTTVYKDTEMYRKTKNSQLNNKPNYTFNPPVRLLGVIFWLGVALSSGLG